MDDGHRGRGADRLKMFRLAKRWFTGLILALSLIGVVFTQTGNPPNAADLKIWREFVSLLKSGRFSVDRIRPMAGLAGFESTLMGFLNQMKQGAHWEEWEVEPEIQKVGVKTNFIIPLSFENGDRTSYCFTFIEDSGSWYFHHLEAIFIRLDKTPPPPTSNFPDTTEAQKAWDREENYWSKIVQWYNILAKEKGKTFFLDLLKDGNGFFVWATSRAPFLPPHKAFIIFLCWEQARLRGHNVQGDWVTLEKLTDEEAVIRILPIYFMLYRAAGHLKEQISFEDYKNIFETIWQDRARAAGWTLAIEYKDQQGYTECVFRFKRKNG